MNKKYYIPDNRHLCFPDKSLKDLFVSFKLTETGHKYEKACQVGGKPIGVSTYCAICGDGITEFLSAEVIPTDDLYLWLADNMLQIVGGLYWEIVVRDDLSTLILVHYSSIIGSRWLTIVDADTIPELKPYLKERV